MKRIKITFMFIAFIATIGMISMAFAHGGWGDDAYGGRINYGPGYDDYMMGGTGMMGYGRGMGPDMMGYGPGYASYGRGDYPADLSRADSDKLQQAQDKFFDETLTLRHQIRDKQFALNDELNSAKPDKAKVADLQKELSRLQADYDQEMLSYRMEVRKLLPQSADRNDYSYGYGPGYGGCNW
jgi:Spy/CpxP family protein refolding chaperone